MDVANDADDFTSNAGAVRKSEDDGLADRIFVGEICTYKRLRDDGDGGRGHVVARFERAAGDERDVHHVEVGWGDGNVVGHASFGRGSWRFVFDIECEVDETVGDGEWNGESGFFHSGLGMKAR